MMQTSRFDEKLDGLKQKLASAESTACKVSNRLQTLCREIESLKIAILQHELEKRKHLLASRAGFTLVVRDNKKLGITLGATALGAILGGALGRDWFSALNGGLSSFDGVLQEVGKAEWAVSLDSKLLVVPRNQIPPGCVWVILESLLLALEALREKTRAGSLVGDSIGSLVARLKEVKPELRYLVPPNLIQVPRS